MSENYLMLNGKRIELTEEQVKTLTVEEKKNAFDRAENNGYYFITAKGTVKKLTDYHDNADTSMFSVANYCTDIALMEQRALHETLNRLLWRYSEEHGGDSEWNGNNFHWSIVCHHENISPIVVSTAKEDGVIYFKDEKTAQSAIDEIVKPFMKQHPEFVW